MAVFKLGPSLVRNVSTLSKAQAIALLQPLIAVLESGGIRTVAEDVLNCCKELTGAQAGYIALYDEEKKENVPLFLDPGISVCKVDRTLSMPLRGLREKAYATKQVIVENNFCNSDYVQYMPPGHALLEAVLLAPMIVSGRVAGLIGLANKPGGFDGYDVEIAEVFSRLISLTLEKEEGISSLARKEERLRFLTENASDVIVSTDREFNVAFWNRRAEEVFGFEKGEAIGKALTELIPSLAAPLESAFEQKCCNDDPKDSHFEVQVKSPSGGMIVLDVSHAMFQTGENTFITFIFRDVSLRKKMEEELKRFERLNLVGQMAASIGHEIRNPLTTVRGYLQYYKYKADKAMSSNNIDLMIEELDRANQIITQFLSLAANKASRKEPLDLCECVKEIIPQIYSDSLANERRINLELGATRQIPLDKNEIRQLVFNLVRNALEGTIAGGTIRISTYMEGDIVNLSIYDDGPPIPEEVLKQLGTPFFTTKPHGAGLGLAICFSIAYRHNANISVKSDENGNIFTVRFHS